MTISSQVRKSGPFVGNDSSTVFPFTFKVFSSSDMYVVKTDTDLGVDTTLVLNTDYTVSLNADQNTSPGGTITLPIALATGFNLTVTSSLQYLQPTDLTNQGGFYPSVITNALDRLTILCQQLFDSVGRSLKVSVSTPAGVQTTLPPPAANMLIGWNPTADNLQNMNPAALATVVAFGTANADLFDGDGATTQFALSANPGALNNLDVSIGGVTQTPGLDYTWSAGTTITFTSPPPAGTDNVLVRYMQGLPQGSTAADLVSYTPGGGGAQATNVNAKLREFVSAKDFGAVGNGVVDDTAAIQRAIDSSSGGITVHLPAGTYKTTSTIYLRRSGVHLVGDGFGVTLVKFVNASGGIMFAGDTNTYNSTAQYESCALEDFEVLSSGSAATDASIVVDLSSFSYSHFNIEAQTKRAYGVIYYGQGNSGVAPYYNHIESTGLFGGLDYTQVAFQFRGGAFSGGSNGPNANVIGPITRAASLDCLADIRVGQGNLFNNISGESIGGTYFLLGGSSSVSTGTSSGSNGATTLKDTGKAWTTNAFINGAVQITAGTGQGQVRIIKTNSATQLSLYEPWETIPDATSQYAIFEGKASKNKFVNIRAEGLDSLNPDFIYAYPGSNFSEFSQMSVESLGSGKHVIDYTGSPSNVFYGHRQVTFTHVFTTPGAGANVNAYPRLSVWGGIKLPGDYVVEWVKAEVDYFNHGDVATITLDVGGSAVGAGDQTLSIAIPDGESQGLALPGGTQKVSHNGTNRSMFLNLQTGAAFSAGRSVIVTICVTLV